MGDYLIYILTLNWWYLETHYNGFTVFFGVTISNSVSPFTEDITCTTLTSSH